MVQPMGIQEPLILAPVEPQQANGATNGTSNMSRFDPHFTQNVINATGPKASPRIKTVMGSLIRHLHDFCRENEITIDEWMAAVDLVHIQGARQTLS